MDWNKIKSVVLIVHLVQVLMLIESSNGALENKHTLRIASELSPHFLIKLAENGRYVRYKGFVKDFCEELSNVLGYQYEIVLPSEYRSQNTKPNITRRDSWDAVFGMVVRNEADLAFGNAHVTIERAQIVDFSAPVLTSHFSILYKMPNDSYQLVDDKNSSFWIMFGPFPFEVWIPFMLLALLYLGFLKLRYLPANRSWLFISQKLVYSKKIAKFSLSIWIIFLLISYTSNYCAQKFLQANTGLNRKAETLMDIVSQRYVKIGWLARGPVERFFTNTGNDIYKKVYIENVGRDWLSSDDEGVSKILEENGKFAFILDSLSAKLKAKEDCSLYTLPYEFGPMRQLAVATPIGSQLREQINQAVLYLNEQGIFEALYNRWFATLDMGNGCSSKSKSLQQKAVTTASIEEMSPLFVLAVLGLLLATVVEIVETQLLKKMLKTPQPKPPRQQQQHMELLSKFNSDNI